MPSKGREGIAMGGKWQLWGKDGAQLSRGEQMSRARIQCFFLCWGCAHILILTDAPIALTSMHSFLTLHMLIPLPILHKLGQEVGTLNSMALQLQAQQEEDRPLFSAP